MANLLIEVTNSVGLHARPAGEFVKEASKFPCEIEVRNATDEGDFVNAKSILKVLTLGVQQGYQIQINAEGEQADEAIAALKVLIENNFGE